MTKSNQQDSLVSLTDSELHVIAQSHELTSKINELHENIDTLLMPIIERSNEMSADELQTLIQLLPHGFHRSELRSILKQKQ